RHGPTSVAISPDGNRIVSGSRVENDLNAFRLRGNSSNKEVKVWDAGMDQNLLTFNFNRHGPLVTHMAISPDCKRIITRTQNNALKVWDAATGQDLITLKGQISTIYSVAISPDGKRIVTGGGQFLWLFRPDGHPNVSRDNCSVKVWDAGTGQ